MKFSLDSEFILKRVSQEEIFERFLNIDVQTHSLFSSPLRVDHKPTCNFFYSRSGDLLYKDFSGHFTGNCFQIVKFIYNCDYNQALQIIAKEFKLIEGDNIIERIPKVFNKQIKEKADIKVQWASFEKDDLNYFKQFGITLKTLNFFEVGKCKFFWINNTLIYSTKKENPAYGYYFGKNELKIYLPFNTPRFYCNTNIIQGLKQLPKQGNRLIITKSLKDVMTFYELGIPAIAPQGESQIIPESLANELKKRFKIIYVLYDFDLTGIRSANKMKKLYGFKILFLTNGRFKTYNFKAKDISDYVKIKHRIKR